MSSLGETVTRLRSERGLSQEELARLVGIGRGSISHIEMGRRTPSLPLAHRLAKELGVSLDTLMGESEKALA